MTEFFEKKGDYFVFDVEAQLMGDTTHIAYYPEVKRFWRAAGRTLYWLGLRTLPNEPFPELPEEELLLMAMDRYGVDMACVLPENFIETTGGATRWAPNGWVASICEKHPERFLVTPNFGAFSRRPMKDILWELDYFVRERGCKIVKFYPPGDTYINDPNIFPFYRRCAELGITVCIHTGGSWVPPGKSAHCHPLLLEDVANEFESLTIIAYHLGWPFNHELNVVASKYKNINVSLSMFMPWAVSRPRRAQEIIGEALLFVGAKRMMWGTDYAKWPPQIRYALEGWRDFQIPDDLRRDYGYPAVTEEMRRDIFGLNLARLLKIEPTKRAPLGHVPLPAESAAAALVVPTR